MQDRDAEQEGEPAGKHARQGAAPLRRPAVDDDEEGQRHEPEQRAGGGVGAEGLAVDEGEDEEDRAGDDRQAAEDAGHRDAPPAPGERDDDDAGRSQQQLRQQDRHYGASATAREWRRLRRLRSSTRAAGVGIAVAVSSIEAGPTMKLNRSMCIGKVTVRGASTAGR